MPKCNPRSVISVTHRRCDPGNPGMGSKMNGVAARSHHDTILPLFCPTGQPNFEKGEIADAANASLLCMGLFSSFGLEAQSWLVARRADRTLSPSARAT